MLSVGVHSGVLGKPTCRQRHRREDAWRAGGSSGASRTVRRQADSVQGAVRTGLEGLCPDPGDAIEPRPQQGPVVGRGRGDHQFEGRFKLA
jgi:hypothetical protein